MAEQEGPMGVAKRVAALLKVGKSDEAVELASAEARARPAPEAFSALAHALMFAGRRAEALAAADQAARAAPDEPGLLFLRARARFANGDAAGALTDAESALGSGSAPVHAYYRDSLLLLGAACLADLGREAEARGWLAKAAPDSRVHAGRLLSSEDLGRRLAAA